jgi:hypothetical protein
MKTNKLVPCDSQELEKIQQYRDQLEDQLRQGSLTPPIIIPLSPEEESAVDDLRFLCLQIRDRTTILSDLRSLMRKHAAALLKLEN